MPLLRFDRCPHGLRAGIHGLHGSHRRIIPLDVPHLQPDFSNIII